MNKGFEERALWRMPEDHIEKICGTCTSLAIRGGVMQKRELRADELEQESVIDLSESAVHGT